MKYKVIRDCYGFQNRYWRAGTIVEIPDGIKPPEHFKPVNEVNSSKNSGEKGSKE